MTSKLLLSVFALTVLLSGLGFSVSAYPQEPAPADKDDPQPFVPPLEDRDSHGASEGKPPAEPAAQRPAEPAAQRPAEPSAQRPADPAAAPKAVSQKDKPRDREPNIIFEPFGQFAHSSGKTKLYFIPTFLKTQWIHVRPLCQSFNMDFVSFSTQEESDAFIKYAEANHEKLETYTLLGAYTPIAKSTQDYYWINSGKHLNYPLRFPPGEPNFLGGREYCLSLMKNGTNQLNHNDFDCVETACKFVCQSFKS